MPALKGAEPERRGTGAPACLEHDARRRWDLSVPPPHRLCTASALSFLCCARSKLAAARNLVHRQQRRPGGAAGRLRSVCSAASSRGLLALTRQRAPEGLESSRRAAAVLGSGLIRALTLTSRRRRRCSVGAYAERRASRRRALQPRCSVQVLAALSCPRSACAPPSPPTPGTPSRRPEASLEAQPSNSAQRQAAESASRAGPGRVPRPSLLLRPPPYLRRCIRASLLCPTRSRAQLCVCVPQRRFSSCCILRIDEGSSSRGSGTETREALARAASGRSETEEEALASCRG
jgi:hypothetical protein